jgi:four helix bundle protein
MNQNPNKYNLEERTFLFAKRVRDYIKILPRTLSTIEYGKQIIRSSSSIAANYIEANEALSKKDFLMRIKICRKESKETLLWLKLIDNDSDEKNKLLIEGTELMKIFGAIVTKSV